jgi:PAS domain S-box-containing protein
LAYGDEDDDDDDDGMDDDGGDADDAGVSTAQSSSRPRRRAATQEERLQRSRERNRVHARKSRLRKKFFVDSLKASLDALEAENRALRGFVKATFGKDFEDLSQADAAKLAPVAPAASSSSAAPASATAPAAATGLIARGGSKATRVLELDDFELMKNIDLTQQNFVVSDPNMPDNPIVFASKGFYDLTGYSPAEVINKNCRFLQGPLTDPKSVAVIREAIRRGEDASVCLINYRKDQTPFWNKFMVAPLRDIRGRIVNYVGVQCEIPEHQAKQLLRACAAQRERDTHTSIAANTAATAVAASASAKPITASAAAAAMRASAQAPQTREMPALLPDDLAMPLQ